MTTHIAILKKRYLQLILDGQKSIECRLTKIRRTPYQSIVKGQTIYLKESAGPIRALAQAQKVLFRQDLTPRDIQKLKIKYNQQILGTDQFWQQKENARYATIIWLKNIRPITPKKFTQKGQAAWITCP